MLSPTAVESNVEEDERVETRRVVYSDSTTSEDQQQQSEPPASVEDTTEEQQAPEAKNDDDDGGDEDDDDVTVIVLDHSPNENEGQRLTIAWTGDAGPQVEERRRAIMLRELQRVQRSSFMHFVILCLIPTVLLFVVIATIVSDDEECYSEATLCYKEPRSFINAFTTRCICEAIAVPRSN